MENRKELLDHLELVHSTPMGIERIKRNLNTQDCDVVEYCKEKILQENCHIYRQGKNWYCEVDNIRIAINAYSYTIITAHLIVKRR